LTSGHNALRCLQQRQQQHLSNNVFYLHFRDF